MSRQDEQPADFEAALAPFRLPPPPNDIAPEIAHACHLGFSIAADLLALHRTCPRRACRNACSVAEGRHCQAEFPAMAFDMVLGMQLFLLAIPHETAMRLHARRGAALGGPPDDLLGLELDLVRLAAPARDGSA